MGATEDLIDIWWRSVNDLLDLAGSLDADDWGKETDLEGWDVRAVISHVAHLEGVLAGAPNEQADVEIGGHVRTPMSQFTEIGVLTRRSATGTDIVDEIRRYTKVRHDDLLAHVPDLDAPAPGIFGAIGWTNRTLLRNRPLDVWMHEQDVRRAVGRPGGLECPGAAHASSYLMESLGFVLAKRAGAQPGQTLVAHVGTDTRAFGIDESGKGRALTEVPAEPSVTLTMDRETFIRLAGGRSHDTSAVTVEGDPDLAARVLASIAVTP